MRNRMSENKTDEEGYGEMTERYIEENPEAFDWLAER